MKLCCIVKPSAVPNADAIALALTEAGIPVIERKDITYTPSLVGILYDHMPDEAVSEITRRMDQKPGIALLVSANSIEHLLDVVGRESNPGLCAPRSLRARFGRNAPEERVGTWSWWENALHRPVDEREARRDLRLLFS